MKYKNLQGVVDELKGAVKAHGKQAKVIEEHISEMNKKTPLKKYKSHAQRKAVHASKAESPNKKALVGNQDQLPENLKKEILASPMTKKVSWMYGGKKYSGDFIRETKDKIFARTHNNKVKTIVKGKTKRS